MRNPTPLSVKVPAVAAFFVVIISVFISQQVLSRLASTQREQLETLSEVHLDGLSSALSDAVLREDVWETFSILDRSRQGMEGVKALETVVTSIDGDVLAASDPHALPTGGKLPGLYDAVRSAAGRFHMDEESQLAFARRDILYNGQPIGSVFAKLDISGLLQERFNVLTALITTNAVLTLISVVAAWLTVRRMMRPVGVLAAHLERSSSGRVSPIEAKDFSKAGSEFQRLFSAFNGMALGLEERDQLLRKMAEEEKLASLGRLASSMAHEINNPLGGIFNALDTLKHHGDKPDVQLKSISLIERGLRGIRDVVRSTLMIWSGDRDGRVLDTQDFEDLQVLIGPEVKRREIVLDWQIELQSDTGIPASNVRQIMLNLLLNACKASPAGGTVKVRSRRRNDDIILQISDDGEGMPEFAMRTLVDPASTPSPFASGHGLGLWTVQRLIRELNGEVIVESKPGAGTAISVTIPLTSKGERKDAA